MEIVKWKIQILELWRMGNYYYFKSFFISIISCWEEEKKRKQICVWEWRNCLIENIAMGSSVCA